MNSDTGNVSAIIRITSIAETNLSAQAVSLQVLSALQRFAGTSDGVVIDTAFVTDEDHDYDPDLSVWAFDLDFLVWYSE